MQNQLCTFNKWSEFVEHCYKISKVKPNASPGIFTKKSAKTSILKSVDDVSYYDDDLASVIHPLYTLYGKSGDQCRLNSYNKLLLNPKVSENIYLYRVSTVQLKRIYIWYGKYKILNTFEKDHVGEDGQMRKIIMLNLERV